MHTILKTGVVAAALLLSTTTFTHAATGDIRNLPGYSTVNLASGFTDFLKKNPEVVERLAKNEALSKQVFANIAMQRQLMNNIKPLPEDVRKRQKRLQNKPNENISNEAAELIKRATANYEAAQNDPDLAAALASEASEGANQQAAAPSTDNTEAVAENAPYAVTNVNAIPSTEDLAPDANGWPKYLRAPAHCAPPAADVTYHYEFRMDHETNSPMLPSAAGKLAAHDKNKIIANYFYPYSLGGGDVRDVYLKHNEALAIPFIMTGNVGIQQHGYRGANMDRVISISDCPGDIGTPWTGNNLGKNCVGKDSQDQDLVWTSTRATSSHCHVELGKRYFLNIHPTTPIERIVDDSAENQRRRELYKQRCETGNIAVPKMCIDGSLKESSSICYYQAGKGNVCIRQENGKTLNDVNGNRLLVAAPANYYPQIPAACQGKQCKIGALTIGGAIPYRLKPVPYNGPCLQQGPYPLNYNSTTCGRSFNGRTCARNGSVTIECTDPQGELSSVRLVKGCMTGQHPVWLEGYGEPIHSRLVCSVSNIENAPTYDHAEAARNPELYRQRYVFLNGYLQTPEMQGQTGTSQPGPYAPPSSATNGYGNSNAAANTPTAQTAPAPKSGAAVATGASAQSTTFPDSIVPDNILPQFPTPSFPDIGGIGQPGVPDFGGSSGGIIGGGGGSSGGINTSTSSGGINTSTSSGGGGINSSTSSSGGVNTSTSSGGTTPPSTSSSSGANTSTSSGGGGSLGGGGGIIGGGGGLGGGGGGGGFGPSLHDLINEVNRRNEELMRNLTNPF